MKDRDHPRNRVFLGGSILFNHGHSSFDCLVKDLSDGGARITTENVLAVPDCFTLALSDGRTFACEVRWRKIKLIGVAFVAAP